MAAVVCNLVSVVFNSDICAGMCADMCADMCSAVTRLRLQTVTQEGHVVSSSYMAAVLWYRSVWSGHIGLRFYGNCPQQRQQRRPPP